MHRTGGRDSTADDAIDSGLHRPASRRHGFGVCSLRGWLAARRPDIVVDVFEPQEACTLAITGFEIDTAVGQLPAGSYTVRYEVDGEPFCGLEPFQFEVAAAPEIIPGGRPGGDSADSPFRSRSVDTIRPLDFRRGRQRR